MKRRRIAAMGWAAGLLLASTAAPTAASAAGVPLSGRVVAPQGEILEGVSIQLLPYVSPRQAARSRIAGEEPQEVAVTKPDADGRFEIEAPEVGMWRLRIEARGRLPMTIAAVPLLHEAALPDVELPTAHEVTVEVLDPLGEPVAGAWVRATPDDARFSSSGIFLRGFGRGWQPSPRWAKTSSEGSAVLLRAREESITLRAAAPGWVESKEANTDAPSVVLQLREGRAQPIRAVDGRGDPVGGALLLYGEGEWPLVADEEGRATPEVPRRGKLRLEVSDLDDRRWDGSLPEPSGEEPRAIEIRLENPRRVVGRVIDAESRESVAGALVWASREPNLATVSDNHGTFDLPAARKGEVFLRVALSGYREGGTRWAERSSHEPVIALRPGAQVRGEVVDAQGRAVAGAVVTYREHDPATRRFITYYGDSGTLARTDSDGRFFLAGLEPDQPYRIRARHDDLAPAEIELAPLAPLATATGLRLVLEDGARLTGRVVDASGAPVAGARVVLEGAAGGSEGRRFRAMRRPGLGPPSESWSGADGVFELAHLEAGDFDLTVEAAGFASTTLPGVRIEEGAGGIDVGAIELESGAELAGRVVDSRGRALPGAEIWAMTPNPMNRMRFRFGGPQTESSTTSAADGSFLLSDRRPGEKVDVMAQKSGYSTSLVSGVEVPSIEPVEIVLGPASNLSGRVVDPRGEPVPGARVEAFVEGGGSTGGGGGVFMIAMAGTTVADEEGAFTLEDLEPGTLGLAVSARGFRKTERSNIEVPFGQDVEDLEIEMLTGASVRGRVRGADGRPAIGARVAVVESQRRFGPGNWGTRTDGDGAYFLEGIEPGTRLIRASHDDEGEVTRELEVSEGENSLDLVFEGGVEVSGRVVDELGVPVAGAAVRLGPADRGFYGGNSETSDSDGSFRFRGVRDGAYKLSADKDGYAPAPEPLNLEVAGAPVVGAEVRLVPGAKIGGRIHGLEPTLLAEVTVIAASTPGRFVRGEVRHDGTYQVMDLSPGEWTVTARTADGRGRADGRATLAAGQPEALLDLEFGMGLTVSGQVLRGDEPLAGVGVGLTGLDVQSHGRATTSRDGRFSIGGLDSGRHRLQVMDFSSGLQHTEDHEIRTDRELLVELRVSRVSGRIVDSADSSPLDGAVVRLEPMGAEQEDFSRYLNRGSSTDAAGLFFIHNVSAGTYRLVAEKDGYAPGERTVSVDPDRALGEIELALQPTDGVSLRVFLPGGGAPSRVSVAVLDTGGRVVTSGVYPADQEGSVRLSRVPAGSWRLLVAAAGTAVSSVGVVSPGGGSDVRLVPEARVEVVVPDLSDDRTLVRIEAVGPDGQPAPRFTWGGSVERDWRASFGRARLDGLAAGSWTIRVTAPDGRTWRERATLSAGGNAPLVLE